MIITLDPLKKKFKIVKLESWLSQKSQPGDMQVKAQKHGKAKIKKGLLNEW